MLYSNRLCEKISVNSKTVIKTLCGERLENSRSDFLQYTTDTAICQGSLDISLLEWSAAEWNQADIRRLSRACQGFIDFLIALSTITAADTPSALAAAFSLSVYCGGIVSFTVFFISIIISYIVISFPISSSGSNSFSYLSDKV